MNKFEDSYFAHGLRLMDMGDFEGAITMFDNALKLGLGDLAEIHVCRGEALAYLGEWQGAEDSINEALQLQPYLATAYNERGNVYRFQGHLNAPSTIIRWRSISSRITTRLVSTARWHLNRGADLPMPKRTSRKPCS